MSQYTKCTFEGCPDNKQNPTSLYCMNCAEKVEDTIRFEDFDNPDDYYFQIFNGDADAVECHKRLLGDWYGLSARDISNAFAEANGLGTAADHMRRVSGNPDAHSPADFCSVTDHAVVVNGKRYKSIKSWAQKNFEDDKIEYATQRMRRKLFLHRGMFKSNHQKARNGGMYTAELIIDEGVPWSDRHQSYGSVR